MGDDQVAAIYLAARYRELRDDLFKATYLPAHEALAQQSSTSTTPAATKSQPATTATKPHSATGTRKTGATAAQAPLTLTTPKQKASYAIGTSIARIR